MHPVDCPGWEYRDHPDTSKVLPDRCKSLLLALRSGVVAIDRTVHDTRPIHGRLFENLTPKVAPYYAGHYRGEKFRCLDHYRVGVRTDARVGVAPAKVQADLSHFSTAVLSAGFLALDAAFALPNSKLPTEDKLYNLVVYACRVLVEFLRIHPYANGNGHMGRFLVWMITAKFGYWPKKWPLDASPPYGTLIANYRSGDPLPLEEFVLRSIAGT